MRLSDCQPSSTVVASKPPTSQHVYHAHGQIRSVSLAFLYVGTHLLGHGTGKSLAQKAQN